MSEANRHAESKDPLELHIIGAPKKFQTAALLFAVRQIRRPTYQQAAAEMQPSEARPVRVKDPAPHNYCPGITVTGSALAITGPCASPVVTSMRITCPGSGGTSPMRRASTSMRSGSRNEASSSRSA